MRKEFVKVPVMSYEIVLKAIYTFDELSNDAKQKAITDARAAWEDENNRAIESMIIRLIPLESILLVLTNWKVKRLKHISLTIIF